jgi:hypothetical protein
VGISEIAIVGLGDSDTSAKIDFTVHLDVRQTPNRGLGLHCSYFGGQEDMMEGSEAVIKHLNKRTRATVGEAVTSVTT